MPQLDGKQLKTGSVPNTALAGNADIVKRDGSVTMTGNLNMGSQRITSLAAPTGPSDAARLQDVQSIPWKEVVKAASTANLTLSGEQTIDGVSCVTGDRVLVKDQSTGAQNGVYIVDSGSWSRASDFDSTDEVEGAVVPVRSGTSNADKRFAQTADNVTVGTTAMVFVDIGGSGSAAYPVEDNKGMTAAVTSADYDDACVTTIAATPSGDGYVQVFVNGLKVEVGDGVRTKDCYFSSDGGTTAKSIAGIAAGDTLYWVGSVAGYQLAATDKIDFDYAV